MTQTPDDFPITIFHNPVCGTSRTVLAMIEVAGYAPTVVEYLKAGWTRPQLEGLLTAMAAGPRDVLRQNAPQVETLDLLNPATSDETILAAMVEHPILVNRPIVVTPKGTRLARPAERVLGLLDRQPPTG